MPYIGKKPENIIATAVDSTTGTFSGAVSAASVDADGGVTVDNITIDGTEIDLSSGDFTIDVAGTISLDTDSGGIYFKDGGTTIGEFINSSSDFMLKSSVQDKDILFKGNDGGSTITALTLDMSDAGTALFGHDVKLVDNAQLTFGDSSDMQIFHDGSNSKIVDSGTGNLNIQADDFNILNAAGDESKITASSNGAVQLLNDNSVKLATTSTGVSVTGGITTSSASSIGGGVVFNEASEDVDFRVESNNNANMFFVDAGNDAISIGSALADSGRKLHIEGADTAIGITLKDTAGTQFGITNDANVMTFRSDSGSTDIFKISGVNASIFSADQTARLNIESNLSSYTALQLKNNNSNNSGIFLVLVDDGGSGIGSISQASNTTVAYNTSSDYRLKENVSYDFDATTRLKQLKPARFNFIADETNTAQDGFLAHEVSDIVPIAITGDKDGTEDIGTVKDADGNIVDSDATELQFTERKKDEVYTSDYTWTKTSTRIVHQQIDHSKLVPLLTKALQEQQATIEALTARIVTLENA